MLPEKEDNRKKRIPRNQRRRTHAVTDSKSKSEQLNNEEVLNLSTSESKQSVKRIGSVSMNHHDDDVLAATAVLKGMLGIGAVKKSYLEQDEEIAVVASRNDKNVNGEKQRVEVEGAGKKKPKVNSNVKAKSGLNSKNGTATPNDAMSSAKLPNKKKKPKKKKNLTPNANVNANASESKVSQGVTTSNSRTTTMTSEGDNSSSALVKTPSQVTKGQKDEEKLSNSNQTARKHNSRSKKNGGGNNNINNNSQLQSPKQVPKEGNNQKKKEEVNFAWSAFQSPPDASALPLPAFSSSDKMIVSSELKTETGASHEEFDGTKSSSKQDINMNILAKSVEELENEVIAAAEAAAAAGEALKEEELQSTLSRTTTSLNQQEQKQEQMDTRDGKDEHDHKKHNANTLYTKEQKTSSGVDLTKLTSPSMLLNEEESELKNKKSSIEEKNADSSNGEQQQKKKLINQNMQAYPQQQYSASAQHQYTNNTHHHHGLSQQQQHFPQQHQQQFITLQVQVPPVLLPGRQMMVHTPNGPVAVVVPENVRPGMIVPVSVLAPVNFATPLQPPPHHHHHHHPSLGQTPPQLLQQHQPPSQIPIPHMPATHSQYGGYINHGIPQQPHPGHHQHRPNSFSTLTNVSNPQMTLLQSQQLEKANNTSMKERDT